MVLFLVRIFFLLTVLAFTIPFAFQDDVVAQGPRYVTWYIILPAGAALLIVLGDILWERKHLSVLGGLFFGILAGIVLAYAVNKILGMTALVFPDFVKDQTFRLAVSLIDAAIVFFCVTIVLQTKDDFRFVVPYVEFSKQMKGNRPVLLDTSVIIDGRIADIVETPIIESQMIAPRFVLAELQAIADSQDKLKRNRGRRGLDVLRQLQKNSQLDLQILDVHVPAVDQASDVDSKLLALATHLDGRIITNDYNLNKVSQLRGVDVININDLANALKPVVLPGETLPIKIIKPGEEPGQGIGYLDDGTMVVAEQGRDHIGKDITITVTSVLQTSAGKMIFGRVG